MADFGHERHSGRARSSVKRESLTADKDEYPANKKIKMESHADEPMDDLPTNARSGHGRSTVTVKVEVRNEDQDEDANGVVSVKPGNNKLKSGEDKRSRSCPYLDTINRSVLDFDFEKLCSVSLSKINVYACLVCGKYFQGRGIGTHAYIHSMSVDHRVFLNIATLRFYCLPDNYEIKDSSLSDITYVLRPTFTSKEIAELDRCTRASRAYDGTSYLPGIVGLNNIKANDYCNVILQALSHVSPIRNYFLLESNTAPLTLGGQADQLLIRFGELIRKLWNPRNFKAHVSPHEMLQAVVIGSDKKFTITQQSDAIQFISWFLNSLDKCLMSHCKKSIIRKVLRGSMRIMSRKVLPIGISLDEKLNLMAKDEYKEKIEETKFLYLTLDLPTPPLFKDPLRENILPQVPLTTLLSKFNGISEKEYKTCRGSQMKRFQVTKMPVYLVLCYKRFTNNTFFKEKNPTIVNFQINDLDLTDLLDASVRETSPKPVYELVANIVHQGEPDKGSYKIHILHRGTGRWFELQDLHVNEILPEMIPLSEAYIQIWRRKVEAN